jgi:hypothetical protein
MSPSSSFLGREGAAGEGFVATEEGTVAGGFVATADAAIAGTVEGVAVVTPEEDAEAEND